MTVVSVIYGDAKILFSISPISIRYPRIFTWKSALPRWIISPDGVNFARSFVLYIVSLGL